MLVNGFERGNTLAGVAEAVVILSYRVAAQHTEDRDRDLAGCILRRHVRIDLAWIISLIPIAAPHGVAIGAILVFTIGRCYDMIFLIQIIKGVCIYKP